MAHKSCEGVCVRVHGGLRKRRRRIDALPVLVDNMGIPFRVELGPLRHVVLAAVLPRTEPKQNKVNVMRAGLRENTVDLRVVELTLLGLKLLPVNGNFECIGMQILNCGPHFWKRRRPVARVVGLRTQHQKWRTIDHQSIAAVLLNDTRDRVHLHLCLHEWPDNG